MPTWFYKIGLIFGSSWFYLWIVLFGLLNPKRCQIVYAGILSTILCVMVNYNLKLWFKIPLNLGLSGYAFPSGHMQAAGFIYSWLALHRIFKLQYFLIPLLSWIALSLIHFGYHNPLDLLGGLGSALIMVAAFYFSYHKQACFLLVCLELLVINLILYLWQQGLDLKIMSTTALFFIIFFLQDLFPCLSPPTSRD